MLHAKLLRRLSSILLMVHLQIMAQDEFSFAPTEIVTESLFSTVTSPTNSDDVYSSTCDFDLENIENLLPYLPDICTEIYMNRTNNDLYDLYLEESQHFAEFYKKLNDYELRGEANGDKEELTKRPFEAQLRYNIYNKVDWSECVTWANNTAADYLKCLKDKRLKLMKLVPGPEEK